LADYFERALEAGDGAAQAIEVSNWIPQLVERIGPGADPAQSRVAPVALAELAAMVSAKQVSRDAARVVLTALVHEGGEPRVIVDRDGLGALSDSDGGGLAEVVAAALVANPDAAAKVAGGNMKAIGPLVGYVMRETKGRADGGEVTRLIREQVAG
jgi:aspartyl-tRNA(Asn)/glutamyl-tRNA(Gln) amidotransferase subunit B